MANPKNPLDKFITYTVHYELHAAANWSDLKAIENADINGVTTPGAASGTLLINTRKDAHQSIDNVRFRYLTPFVNPTTNLAPFAELSMQITEPGGTFFVEKVQNLAKQLNISNIMGGMIWGLKIFFVGRTGDNEIVTIPFRAILPLMLKSMDAKFDVKGGDYTVMFVSASSAVVNQPGSPPSLASSVGYSNRNITVQGFTVGEMISDLERNLNKHYEKVYETERDRGPARKLVYSLKCAFEGKLDHINKESYKPDELRKITFTPQVQIMDMVRTILHSSGAANTEIQSSKSGINKELEPGVQIPTYFCAYEPSSGEARVKIDVRKYTGGGPTYEFDYWFSDAGKNVDVLDFECRFPNMHLWMTGGTYSTGLNTDPIACVAADKPQWWSANVVHADIARQRLEAMITEKIPIIALANDVAMPPAVPLVENRAHASIDHRVVPQTRGAFESIANICGAKNPQQTFTIRGHLDLLDSCVAYPDGSRMPVGAEQGLWVKVNIFNADKTPFYYTGKYKVLTIDNIFSGGKFTQLLTTLMMDP